ncbi:DUF1330 domain-containing protein [Actinomadura rayongensis]|uniref:DUF1330 domain-containing protein n=1 Tax=Actinomadura rayongensis TaxID=1429076 RepID=A0A6I4WDI0_9ACTN|nr:DUF1330 domain-containing protein [Actinomadura rayongensis]MXQ65896.1 DUF1330 domain-containing protein [Actinomadura rayongensis]
MTAYAMAHLRPVPPLHDGVFTYMERIQDTLDPFGGRFLVHGADAEVLEGPFEGAVVVIEFPDLERARAWYASDAYQEILPLRTDNIPGVAILAQGASPDHDSAALGRRMREAQAG